MKKSIAIILAALMLLTIFAGCGSGNSAQEPGAPSAESAAPASNAEQPEEQPTEPEAAAPETDAAEPETSEAETAEPAPAAISYPLVDDGSVEVRYWLPVQDEMLNEVDGADDLQLFREMEKITGVKVDLDLVSMTNAATTFPLMIAGDDHPDMWLNFTMYTYGWDHAVDEEIIVPLEDYLEDMPNLSAIFNSDPDIRRQSFTDGGHMAGIPAIRVINDGHEPQGPWMGYALRQDWLDQLNLEVPETYDDLEQVLTTIQSEIPTAKNPFQFGVGDNTTLFECPNFYGGYNITKDFIVVDGEVRYSPLEQGYRDYVTMMHRWYENGLLSPDFVSQNLPITFAADSVKGEHGAFCLIYTWVNDFYAANDDDFAIVGMHPLKTEPGAEVHVGTYNSMAAPSGAISSGSENVELICQWWDYLFGEDGINLGNWGIEGETYEVKDDGSKTWIGPFLNPDNDPMFNLSLVQWKNLVYNMPGYTQVDREYCLVADEALELVDAWSDCDADYVYPYDVATMTAEESQEYYAAFSDLDTYVNEMSMKFVIGDESLDNWDEFVDTINSMDVDMMIECRQAAMDRYNNR